MNPIVTALLQSWDWRIDVTLVIVITGTLYLKGWLFLRASQTNVTKGKRLANNWRLVSYLSGLTILAIALMSPIDVLASQLFTMHMIQHLLLMMIVPPLLQLANPFPFFLWAVPVSVRREVGQLFSKNSTFRRNLAMVTTPGIAWLVYNITFISWHDPNAYNLALRSEWIHDVEHLTFFGSAMLFWWHVIRPGPHISRGLPYIARIAFVLSAIPINMLAGMMISFSSKPVYTYYESVPRLWGLTVMQDQMAGGLIMWAPGTMMYSLAAAVLILGLVQAEMNKPPLLMSEWNTDEIVAAPSWNSE
jgi:cytochrome c oxidase assembly factor CtaG